MVSFLFEVICIALCAELRAVYLKYIYDLDIILNVVINPNVK